MHLMVKRGSIAMTGAELGGEAENEVDSFKFIQPILKRGLDLVVRDGGAGKRAGSAEGFGGHGSITGERAVAENGDEFEFFGEEEDGGNTVAAADFNGIGKFGGDIAIDEAEVDRAFGAACFIVLGDLLEEGALVDAVAAPCAAEDEDVHAAGEGLDEGALCGSDGGVFATNFVEVMPALLLVMRAGGDVFGVGESGGEG